MHTDAVTGKALTASAKGGKMFKLRSEYKPTGDQPKAIEYLSSRNNRGKKIPDTSRGYRLSEKHSQWQISYRKCKSQHSYLPITKH